MRGRTRASGAGTTWGAGAASPCAPRPRRRRCTRGPTTGPSCAIAASCPWSTTRSVARTSWPSPSTSHPSWPTRQILRQCLGDLAGTVAAASPKQIHMVVVAVVTFCFCRIICYHNSAEDPQNCRSMLLFQRISSFLVLLFILFKYIIVFDIYDIIHSFGF